MSIENPSTPKQKNASESNPQDSIQIGRRNFLKFVGSAVAQSLVMDATPKLREETVVGEATAEGLPTAEGIQETFDLLRREKSCRERRKVGDEQGVYLWELEFQIEGGTAEFSYMRKGKHAVGGSALKTKIYITFFDESGMPEGGHDVAEFKEGKWVISDSSVSLE